MAIAVFAVLAAASVPHFVSMMGNRRVRAAAYAMRSVLLHARAQAASRAANVAVVFDPPFPAGSAAVPGPSDSPVVAVYLDTNHNGVRRAEIRSGGERLLRNPWRFAARFPRVDWGAPAGNGGAELPGLAVGSARMVSFSPLGSSSAGRITVSGGGAVYSVVILGTTGRIRLERLQGNVWLPS